MEPHVVTGMLAWWHMLYQAEFIYYSDLKYGFVVYQTFHLHGSCNTWARTLNALPVNNVHICMIVT